MKVLPVGTQIAWGWQGEPPEIQGCSSKPTGVQVNLKRENVSTNNSTIDLFRANY